MKKLCGFSFFINIANLEAFAWTFSLSTNLLIRKSNCDLITKIAIVQFSDKKPIFIF